MNNLKVQFLRFVSDDGCLKYSLLTNKDILSFSFLWCTVILFSYPMLHGNGSGYAEAEAYGSAEARFFEKLGSGYVLKAYIHMYVYICVYIYIYIY